MADFGKGIQDPSILLHQDHLLQHHFNNGRFEVGESSNRNNHLHAQGVSQQESGPIGLTLTKSPSLMKQIQQLALTQETLKKEQRMHLLNLSQPHPKLKLKACSIPALSLQIGSWKIDSTNEGDLTVKFYYGKKKLVWECLLDARKKKVEIGWSQLSAINAFVDEGNKGRLEIELNEQPQLNEELNFIAKKHTIWSDIQDDFTQDQAQVCRRHTVIFPPRVLDEPFMNLVQCDSRLLTLSEKSFPIWNSPYFQTQNLDFSRNTSIPKLVHPISSYAEVPTQVLNHTNFHQISEPLYCNQVGEHSRSHNIQDINAPIEARIGDDSSSGGNSMVFDEENLCLSGALDFHDQSCWLYSDLGMHELSNGDNGMNQSGFGDYGFNGFDP